MTVDDVAQLLRLARADIGGRVRTVAALNQSLQNVRAGGLGQPGQLIEGVLRLDQCARRPYADEHDALQTQLPIFDFADVREFGGESGDPAQRVAVAEIEIGFV
jgi:hypothetical protein